VPVDAGVTVIPAAAGRPALPPLAPLPAAGSRPSLAHLIATYDALLDEVMPPSLLVTDRGELVHAFGGASRFLHLRDGRQYLDVLDVVDPDLKLVLVGGLKRALNESAPIVFGGIRLLMDGAEGTYRVTIRRVPSRNGGAPHLLISIDDSASERVAAGEPAVATELDLRRISQEHLRGLEAELSHTKENLQAAIEELERSNEKLQASNEELQTSNEELQSTNEELQSVNEELYTVNAEYQRKIGELTELANDMDNLLASTEVGTVFLDRHLNIRKFTPQIAETFSLVPHDVGRPIDNFTHRLDHPELMQDLRRVLTSGDRIERELRGVRGKTFFLRILPYRARASIDGVVLTLIDASGLKAAEDALFHERYLLNSLLATVPEAIGFKDAAGRFIRANQAMAARLGLANPAEAEGRTVFELTAQEVALALHKQDEAVLRSGEPQYDDLEQRPTAEGRGQWDLVTRLPLRDAQGSIVGIIVIFRDVTEQRNAEEDIREAVRRRDQFLAMLSHELRNPLGAVVTATALLRIENVAREGRADSGSGADGATSGDTSIGTERMRRERFLAILDRQSQQMTRLLDDLLEASRVTQNKVELKRQVLDVNVVIQDAVDAVRGQIDSHGIALAVERSPAPLEVDGDPARLQQILVNLLSNAVKYTPRGGHVRIRVEREGREVLVRLQDDGAGIPADMLESVFDLFVQSRRTLDRAAGGLGVGLTLARSLAQMHGGTVTAHSEGEGRGSEFILRLPGLAAAELVMVPPPAGKERDGELGAPPHRALSEGATVVVVEDNPDSREMLRELLELSGFKCRTSDNGTAALALIEELRPEIAILDVGLPEMDGFELARRLRLTRKRGDLCLVALTGYGQPSDQALGVQAGFDAHLVKPVQAEQLLALLRKLRAPSAGQHGTRRARTHS